MPLGIGGHAHEIQTACARCLSAAGVLIAIFFLYMRGNDAVRQAQQAADETEADRRRNIVLPNLPPANQESLKAKQISLALVKGVSFLAKAQSADGAWRSDVYATFKDWHRAHAAGCGRASGSSHVRTGERGESFRRKGCEYLAKLVNADGTIDPGPDGLDYPIYTAALTIQAFSHPTAKEFVKYRDAWVKYLKDRQLTAKLGWKKEEKQYGGWGYCRVAPKKPVPNTFAPPLIESNLSATVFALEALAAAGQLDADTAKAAAVFVKRCQNSDGGFHFIYDDPVRNKAGMASADPPTFHSYGSTTADGLRRLQLCGLPTESAREWLVKNFRADTHPGTYVKAQESNREAVYYYYAASAARAFRDSKLTLPHGRDWAAELAAELARRQSRDGHWENPVELVRENDPLVATANAMIALTQCR